MMRGKRQLRMGCESKYRDPSNYLTDVVLSLLLIDTVD